MQMIEEWDSVTVIWSTTGSPEHGILWYDLNPGNADTNNYFYRLEDPAHTNMFKTIGQNINIGLLYCMISTPSGLTSIEFPMVREADEPVTLIGPQSPSGGIGGVTTSTPLFEWEPIPNVPYYHVLLSDQVFEIEEDSTGALTTTGANIIWQVITSSTSIVYGTPDPSNNFNNLNFPPLVGNTPGNPRPTYNWVVLNNYGNMPELSSDEVGDLMAFEINVVPPFASPVLLEPVSPPDTLTILTGSIIDFVWTSVSAASNYHLYLTRKEETPGASSAYIPIWYIQSTINAVECPAVSILTNGEYRWKIIAEDNQGQGVMAAPEDFYYSVDNKYIWVQVKNADSNQPISGARVEFLPIEGPSLMFTMTDDNGYAWKYMPYGTYIFEFSKDGFITTETAEFIVDENTLDGEGNVYVYYIEPLYSTVFGTVVDDRDSLVIFANVTAINTASGVSEISQSNNSGSFSINLSSGNYSFLASKDGYLSSQTIITYLLPDTNLNLNNIDTLEMSRNLYDLSGVVYNPDNEPISLAHVTCVMGTELYEYTTGSNGSFIFAVANGNWELNAEKPAFWVSSDPLIITILNSSSFNNNLQLTPAANIISGQVYQGAVLSPGEAMVRAIPGAGNIEEVQVNNQGSYILSLPTGTFEINAYLDGYTSPTPVNLSLSAGETISGLNFTLLPNPSYITGKITSNGINPIPGAIVSSGSVSDTTGTQGNYTLNVPSGPHTVTASKTGYITTSSQQVNVAVGQTLSNINIILTPNAATINGSVQSDGDPVYLAAVTAKKDVTGTTYTVQTQENGSYSFSIPYGTYSVWAAKSGFSNSDTSTVTINPGQTINDVNFNIIIDLGYLTGSTLYNGQGLSYTQVNAAALDNPSITFNTQATYYGNFNLPVTPNHQYKITIEKTGFVSYIDTTDTPIVGNQSYNFGDITMTQLQSQLKGKVYQTDSTTIIIGAAVTAVKQSTGVPYSSTTNNQGSYTLNLNSGTYHVTASKSGFLISERDTTISAGVIITGFKFYLQPNLASLQGSVKRSSTQAAIANALVTAANVSTQQGASAYTNETGFYQFTSLVQGSYNITVTHSQYQTGNASGVNLLGGNTTTQNFSLIGLDGSIAGNVSDNFGGTVSGATIEAQKATGEIFFITTGSIGNYTLVNLPPGNYNLSAAKEGYSVGQITGLVLTPAGSLTGQNFNLIRSDGIIVGKALNPAGQGLANATVTANDSAGNVGYAASAPNGLFTISNLSTANNYHLSVSLGGSSLAQGMISTSLWQWGVTDTAFFYLISDSLWISGYVVNQGNTPKNNIKVKAVSGSLSKFAYSNANGYYSIAEIAPQKTYKVFTDAYNTQLVNDTVNVVVTFSNQPADTLMLIESSSSISGLIINAAGAGMANVQVKAKRLTDGFIISAISDGSGSYTIPNLLDTTYYVYPTKSGYTATVLNDDTLTVGINQHLTGIDFRLSQILITISGNLSNGFSGGMPSENIILWASTKLDTEITDNSGNYTFTGMPPSVQYQLSSNLPPVQYDNDDSTFVAGTSNKSNINLIVSPHNSSIYGVVREAEPPSYFPIGNAAVSLNLEDPIFTNAAGEFAFNYLQPDDYYLTFDKPGYIGSDTTFNISISDTISLYIGLENLINSISGTVTNSVLGDTVRLNNAIVIIRNLETGVQYKDTTVSGIYSFVDLIVNDRYLITAEKKGYQIYTSDTLTFLQNNIANFALTPFQNSVYGTVRNTSLQPIANAVVSISDFGASIEYDNTNSFGDYSFLLSPGNYQLYAVTPSGLDSYHENIFFNSGFSARKMLTVRNTGKLEGNVETVYGLIPPGHAVITLYNNINSYLYSIESDDNGYFHFEGLRANPYTISASLAGYEFKNSPQVFTAALGVTSNIQFIVFSTNNAVTGSVKELTSNANIGGASVYLFKTELPDTSTQKKTTSAAGTFSFQNLDAGHYMLWAEKSGYVTIDSTEFDVFGNSTVQKTLKLQLITGAISGTTINTLTSTPLSGVDVNLKSVSPGYDSTQVTGSSGTFIFSPPDIGFYILKAAKSGYIVQPDSFYLDFKLTTSISGKTFQLTPDIDTVNVSGYVIHGNDSLQNVKIYFQSVITSFKDSTLTDSDGFYSRNIIAPEEILIRAVLSGFPDQVSPAYSIVSGSIQHDFRFPAGQMIFHVTSDGITPLPYIGLNINNTLKGIDYDTLTNTMGIASTYNRLPGDSLNPVPYTVSITDNRPNIVPLQPLTIPLGYDEIDSVDIILGVTYEPLEVVPAKATIWVHLFAAKALNLPDSSVKMLYKLPSESVYAEKYMEIFGDSAAYDIYRSFIPPQPLSGNMYYKFQIEGDGLTFVNQPDSFTVTSQGVLSILKLEPSNTSVQLGYSKTFILEAYDDVYNLLNDSLDNVQWSHWDALNQADTTSLGGLTYYYDDTSAVGIPLPTRVVFTSDPDSAGTVKIKATAFKGDVTLSKTATLLTERRVLGTMSISSTGNKTSVANTDSVTFTINALDTAGITMIPPPLEWTFEPEGLGTLTALSEYQARFKPYPSKVGRVMVSAADTLSGISAQFNTQSSNVNNHGLFITQKIYNTTQTIIDDGAGFSLSIPPGSVIPGQNFSIKLNRPPLPQVKQTRPSKEINMDSYALTIEGGSFAAAMDSMELTLPIPEETKRLQTAIGKWDDDSLRWDDLGGIISSDGNYISASIKGFSEFVVIGNSKPLGIENLEFHPNPFSSTKGDLSIEFIINSDMDTNPEVTMKLYNMRGDLVRTLLNRESKSKGPHNRDNDPVIWDGLTNDELMARNGRYLLQMIVEDPSGKKEYFDTVVLIK